MTRPRKLTKTYYKNAVLLDDETYRYVMMHKYPKEPLGSVVHRLIGKSRAKQGDDLKKYDALQQHEEHPENADYSILENDSDFNSVWELKNTAPDILDRMLGNE